MPCKIVGGTKVPGNEKSWERKFLRMKGTRTKGPGNESSRELSFPGKVPGNEKSRERKFPIGTIRSWERKVLGTKSPSTHKITSYARKLPSTVSKYKIQIVCTVYVRLVHGLSKTCRDARPLGQTTGQHGTRSEMK